MALMNCIKSSSSGSSASMKADLTKELYTLTKTNYTYTAEKDAVIIGTWNSGAASFYMNIDGVAIFAPNNCTYMTSIGSGEYGIAVAKGSVIEIRPNSSLDPHIHVYEMA